VTRVICNEASFRAQARWQRACACCGAGGAFHAHHVVDKAILRDRCGLRGKELYDTRNALRLCEGLDGNRCHLQFENRRVVVTTKMLTDENIEYAFEKLGLYGADYLRQEYDDAARDPRISELESELMLAAS
jgi:hypothetical protein